LTTASCIVREPDADTLLLSCFQKALGHELPNLLVVAQGLARLLEGDAALGPETQQVLGRLAQAIQKPDGLVRRLGALGRLVREPPRWEPVPLGELVHEVAVVVRQEKGLPPATLVLASDLPPVVTDRERLRQALHQVLRNAHQAARPELSLAVRVEWHEGRRILRLTDNGRGLPDRPLDTLFHPFHPANPGQGLGLFTARTSAELYLPSPDAPTT
jgi:signal transduction histidine kinase